MLSFFSSLVNEYSEQLSKSEKAIIKRLNEQAKEIPDLTISELSKRVFISNSSMYRLIKKLGYKGYPEFKYKVADSLKKTTVEHVNTKDYLDGFIGEVMFTHQINEVSIQQAASLILKSNKRLIFGTGWKQKEIADNFSSDMMTYGESFITLRTKDDLLSAIKYVTEEDVLIIVSLHGQTDSYQEVIDFCELNNIPIISVTKVGANPLSSHSEISLYYEESARYHWSAQTLNYLLNLLIHIINERKS